MEEKPYAEQLYEIFLKTGQEPRRLKAALEGFFLEKGSTEAQKNEYGQYLKRRIRPAVEQLIEEENIERIRTLEELGWFQERELEGFLQTARRREKPVSLMYFLQRKNSVYGYHDRDFSL